jgi:MFS family permease
MSYHYIADTAYIPTPSACHKKTRLKGMDSVRATATDSVAFKNELIKQFEKKRNTFQYFGIASLIGYLVLSVLLEIGVFAWILPLKILLLLGVFFFLFLALRMSNKIKKLRNELYPKRKPEDTENDATKKPVKKRSYFNKALLIPIFSVLLLASLVLTGFLIMQWLSLGDGVADVFVSMFIFTFAAMSIALNITLLTALLMFIFHKNPEKEKN